MEVSIKKTYTVQPQEICFCSYKTFCTAHSSYFRKIFYKFWTGNLLYATSAYSGKCPTLRLYQQYGIDFHLLYKVHHNILARLL